MKPEFEVDQIRRFLDRGYTSVSARYAKSALQHYDEQKKVDDTRARKLDDYLNRINNIMWTTWGVKDREFGRAEGDKIIEILEEWASDKGVEL